MKQRSSKLGLAAMMLAAFFTASAVPAAPAAAAETIPEGVIASVIVDSVPRFYYDTKVSGGMTAMWDDALSGKTATIKLYADWNPENGSRLAREGAGSAFEGAICVPSGHEVTIDLNGCSINRGLEAPIEDGTVIYIENNAVLNLTDTTASSGRCGKITGGNSTNSAGGIQVEAGGTLNLWGGSIAENQSGASGGGIVLSGEGSKLYMTGGSIEHNTAVSNGGGIAMVDASLEIVSGTIAENSASGSGGGIYEQGGSAVLQGAVISANTSVAGGGICTTEAAALSLRSTATIQNNIAGSAEVQGRGGGVLAMSSLPIRLSGSPEISANRQSDGVVSNVTFWVNENESFVGPRVENDGVTDRAKVGLNFVGGEERELGFAPEWAGVSIFGADGDFEYILAEGVQYLRRPARTSDYLIYVWIGIGVIVFFALVIAGVAVYHNMQKKKRKQARKHKKAAAKPSGTQSAAASKSAASGSAKHADTAMPEPAQVMDETPTAAKPKPINKFDLPSTDIPDDES